MGNVLPLTFMLKLLTLPNKELKFTKDESEMRKNIKKYTTDEKIHALMPRIIIIVLTFHLFCHTRERIEREEVKKLEEEEKIF